MAFVLNGLADRFSCDTLKREAQITDRYVEENRVELSYHYEQNGVIEVRTGQHFVILHVGGKAIIDCLMVHTQEQQDAGLYWEMEARHSLTGKKGEICRFQIKQKYGMLYELNCGEFNGNR